MNKKDIAIVLGAMTYLGLTFAFIYWAVFSMKQDQLELCLATGRSIEECRFLISR